MNQRIKELELQCWSDESPEWAENVRMVFNIEKFAELIVKECKTALYKQYSNGEFMYLEGCYKAITDHLGISGFEE